LTQTRPSQLVVETTASALREKSKLRRHFRRGSESGGSVAGVSDLLAGITKSCDADSPSPAEDLA